MIGIPPAIDMQLNSVTSISPSFTSYSSNNLADIVARVVEEYRNENGHEEDDDIYNFNDDINNSYNYNNDNKLDADQLEEQPKEDEDKEFEFAIVQTNQLISSSSNIPADEIIYNGEIFPRYPLFDTSLLDDDVVSNQLKSVTISTPPQRRSLSKLFSEERETVSCSSSSESDDLDGVAPETYCVWKPKLESPERCKKTNSTGNTSKRWTLPFRNLLRRSNSDGNFNVKRYEKTSKVAGADDEIETADEINSIKGGNRLRSYLSNKHDGVGLSSNVNGINRN